MALTFLFNTSAIEKRLDKILTSLNRLENKMSDLEAELDAGLEGVSADLSDLGGKIDQVIAALEARPDVDLSDEIATLQAIRDNVQAKSDTIDEALNPPTT